jgi:hypothetical protein
MFELRASIALARLWSHRAPADAASLLARASRRIAEPAECRDLGEATALLVELGASPTPAPLPLSGL